MFMIVAFARQQGQNRPATGPDGDTGQHQPAKPG